MFNNLYGVSSCVWEQMDTGRHVYTAVTCNKTFLIKVNTDLRTSCSVAHIICKKISSLERLINDNISGQGQAIVNQKVENQFSFKQGKNDMV